MKKYLRILFFIAIPFVMNGQGIPFVQKTWAETLQLAKTEKKLIFVDAYASWCGPCKKMDALTFTHQAVTKFFSQHFISFKIDMEKGEGPELNKFLKVSAFPTLYFVSPDQEIVHKTTGFQEANKLINEAKKAMEKYNPTQEMKDMFDAGNRDEQFVLEYVKAQYEANKSSKEIGKEYFQNKDLANLSATDKLISLYVLEESDTRLFEVVKQNQLTLIDQVGEEVFENIVNNACLQTVKKAFEYQYEDLWTEAKMEYTNLFPNEYSDFTQKADWTYSILQKDVELINEVAIKVSKDKAKDQTLILDMNRELDQHFGKVNPDVLKIRKNMLTSCMNQDKSAEVLINLADVYFWLGNTKEAIALLDEAIPMTEKGSESHSKAVTFRSRYESNQH